MALADRWGDTKEKKYGVPRDKMPYQADRQRDAPEPDYPKEPPEVTHPSELPSATGTPDAFWESEHFPLMLAASEVLFGTVLDYFSTSDMEELLQEQLSETEKQRLRASGLFSDEDIENVSAGFQSAFSRVAGNVASRGIDGPAGAEILAQAQAAPFHQLQAQASRLYQTALVSSSQMIASLAQENIAFSRSFGNITKLYQTMLAEGQGQPPGDSLFAEFNEMAMRFNELRQKLEKKGS